MDSTKIPKIWYFSSKKIFFAFLPTPPPQKKHVPVAFIDVASDNYRETFDSYLID